tara:strand:- start:3712 stop:3960 length:249 start_codon:yes stop_codon:yes gene_type:complete
VKYVLAALALALPLSATASDQMELTFDRMKDGTYCGKFYTNTWNNKMVYQCHTKEVWERKGVKFPEEKEEVTLRLLPNQALV